MFTFGEYWFGYAFSLCVIAAGKFVAGSVTRLGEMVTGSLLSAANLLTMVYGTRDFAADSLAHLEMLVSTYGIGREQFRTLLAFVTWGAVQYVLKALWAARMRILARALGVLSRMLRFMGWVFWPLLSILMWFERILKWPTPYVFAPEGLRVLGGPPVKFGYFRWNAKDYFRHPDGSVSKVKLRSGTTVTNLALGTEETQYHWDLLEDVQPRDLSPGECALKGIVSNARPAKLEKGNVLIYDSQYNLFSSGIVVENNLIMCRHKTQHLSSIVVRGSNKTPGRSQQPGVLIEMKRACRLDSVGAPEWDEQKHTCTFLDFQAIPLQKDELSMIGVKSFKEKDMTRKYEMQRASIIYSTDDFGTIVKEEGQLPETTNEIHDLGLALAQIPSIKGASSSAVCVVDGGIKLAGMWLGLPAHSLIKHRGTCNLFMTTDAILANLEHLGLVKSAILTQLQAWGQNLCDQIHAAGWQLAEGNGCCPETEGFTSSVGSPGESREDKRTRALRKFNEYYEALEREQLMREEIERDLDYQQGTWRRGMDYGNDFVTYDGAESRRSLLAMSAEKAIQLAAELLTKEVGSSEPPLPPPSPPPSECESWHSMPDSGAGVLLNHGFPILPCREESTSLDGSHEQLELHLAPVRTSESRASAARLAPIFESPGQSRGDTVRELVQPQIVLSSKVAAPLPRSKAERAWSRQQKCQYFDIGESVETGKRLEYKPPPGLTDPPPIPEHRCDLNTMVKAWKYRLLNDDAPSVLKEIDMFSLMTEPSLPEGYHKPSWIEEHSGYANDATGDVRKRLRRVLDVESNALLRDYMQKSAPNWTPGDEKYAKHGDTILDKDGKPYFRKVGSYPPSRIGKTKKPKDKETDLQKALRKLAESYFAEKKHGCVKGEYKVPLGTKSNIHKSLVAQAAMATASRPDLDATQTSEFEAAVQAVRQKYSDGIGGAKIRSYLEEGERGFLKTFAGFEDKSSGASARYRNLKKAVWSHTFPEEVVDIALSRIILLACAGGQLKELDPIEQINLGCSDCKEIFMKPEGHSPPKFEENRFRLIWISSLIDITAQSLLHKADNAAHTDAFQAGTLTCAALGMGHSKEGLKHLVKAFEAEDVATDNISSDASAFDLSIDASFIEADADRRADNCSDFYVGQLIRRYAHVLCSHVLNNQGDVWIVEKYGVTTSGQLSTTTQNTFARSVQASYGGSKGWVSAGDDLVADKNFDYKRLLHFGVRSRDVESHKNEADFTSHMIDTKTSRAVFKNVEKLLWHLHDSCTDTSTNRERFGGTMHILRDTPEVLRDVSAIITEYKINTEGYVGDTPLVRDFA